MTGHRLLDVPMPALRALIARDVAGASAVVGVEIPHELASLTDVWQFMMNRQTARPESAGWTLHALVIDGVDGPEMVGFAGFKGAPDAVGEVEIGYRVLTACRRQGHALAAVQLLLDRAAREPSVHRVLAVIDHDNAASIAVATHAGLQLEGRRLHERWGPQLLFRHPTTGP